MVLKYHHRSWWCPRITFSLWTHWKFVPSLPTKRFYEYKLKALYYLAISKRFRQLWLLVQRSRKLLLISLFMLFKTPFWRLTPLLLVLISLRIYYHYQRTHSAQTSFHIYVTTIEVFLHLSSHTGLLKRFWKHALSYIQKVEDVHYLKIHVGRKDTQ